MIEKVVDGQWGAGTFASIDRSFGPVLINPCPSPDRLLEVVMEGHVVGSLKYDVVRKTNIFILRKDGGSILKAEAFSPKKGWVKVDGSVIPFLMDRKNLLSPGIIEAADGISVNDEVMVLDPEGSIIGSGIARKSSDQMVGIKGMGVKMRWCSLDLFTLEDGVNNEQMDHESLWKHVISVNRPFLDKDISKAVSFIRNEIGRRERPYAVSFSGGKDSLATLLLVMESGFDPPVLFVDTGLEFPETIEHVHETCRKMGLELIQGKPRTGFFDELDNFGPPGRDHRWCCKVCKLGPMSDIINERFPDGVLTFIGQRRYESESRKSKGPVWENPWVPGQIGASPIQNWNALQVWLYIFHREAEYNHLYDSGYQRIGCWLCPSCDMAEMELVSGTDIDPNEWLEELERYRIRNALPPEWIEFGFNRFKKLPPHMRELAGELGLSILDVTPASRDGSDAMLTLVKGSNTCIDGLSREGVIGKKVSWSRLKELMNVLGPVKIDKETGGISITPQKWDMKREMFEIYPDGTVIIRAPDRNMLEDVTRDLISMVKRAAGCTGCSICVGRCDHGALSIKDRTISLEADSCIHCKSCLGPCPAEDFSEDPFRV